MIYSVSRLVQDILDICNLLGHAKPTRDLKIMGCPRCLITFYKNRKNIRKVCMWHHVSVASNKSYKSFRAWTVGHLGHLANSLKIDPLLMPTLRARGIFVGGYFAENKTLVTIWSLTFGPAVSGYTLNSRKYSEMLCGKGGEIRSTGEIGISQVLNFKNRTGENL